MRIIRYCLQCGSLLVGTKRGGRTRKICPACGRVHYENPVVGVATVIFESGRLLLGQRSEHSGYGGLWCIPCGYVEYDEDVRAAAQRECLEETGLTVGIDQVCQVHSNFHNPNCHTVGIWFDAHVVSGQLTAGDDLVEVGYFDFAKLPDLAFPTDQLVINYLKDRGDFDKLPQKE